MDWFQFISSLVGSLAWPSATIAIVYLLRRGLLALLPRLRQLKYKDLEAQFGDKLNETESEASRLPAPSDTSPVPTENRERFRRVIEISPSYAVIELWIEIESALMDLAKLSGFVTDRKSPTFQVMRQLFESEVIDEAMYMTLKDLRTLRNLAVHPVEDRPITSEQAERYRILTDQVIAAIKLAREKRFGNND